MLSEEETWKSAAFRMRNGSKLVDKKGFDDHKTPQNYASSLFYSGSQKSEVCHIPTESYAISHIPFAYLIFLRKAIVSGAQRAPT